MLTIFNKIVVFILSVILIDVNAQSISLCTTKDSEMGLCVPAFTCESIIELLSPRSLPFAVADHIRQSYCGTFNDVIHICCRSKPNTDVTTFTRNAAPKIYPNELLSRKDIQSGMAILEALDCGHPSDELIISHEVGAKLAEYPWMALLLYEDGPKKTLDDCGGSLISDRYVLTTADCISGKNKKLVSVRLGEHDTDKDIDCTSSYNDKQCAAPIQEIDVEEAIYHRDFSSSKLTNDIGLIRLVKKVVFSTSISPICLPIIPDPKKASLTDLIIAGWGRVKGGVNANVLEKGMVHVKDNEYCQATHKGIKITDKHVCAEGDTCTGDSGGPIFNVATYNGNYRTVQFGIVGARKCASNIPSIFTRVTSYLSWIAGNIRP